MHKNGNLQQQGPPPPQPEVSWQNHFTTLQTEEERPITSGETLELSKAAQSAPHITTSATKKRQWVIVVGNSSERYGGTHLPT